MQVLDRGPRPARLTRFDEHRRFREAQGKQADRIRVEHGAPKRESLCQDVQCGVGK